MHRLTLLVACLGLLGVARGQEEAPVNSLAEEQPKLSLGDKAPALRVMEWVRGEPVSEFEKGRVYAIEFWATWCGPCVAGMPHLSEVQDRFKEQLTVVSVTSSDPQNTLDIVTEFVARNAENMRYRVAFDDLDLTWSAYMAAAGQGGIPCAFLIDKQGRVVWIGHPADPAFEQTITELVEDKFDLARALEERARQEAAANEAREARSKSAGLIESLNTAWQTGEQERALAVADELVALDPESMFRWAWWKFEALMLTIGDHERAYAFVRELSETHYAESPDVLVRFVYGIADSIGIEAPDLDLALDLASRAAELTDRQDSRVLAGLAMVRMQRKEYDEGIEAMRRAIDVATTPQIRASLENELEWYVLEKQVAERRKGGG